MTLARPRLKASHAAISPTDPFDAAVLDRNVFRYLSALATFVVATAIALIANEADMPRTAAVVYLFSVTLVGALVGLWGGLFAALVASGVYNFLMSDPTFRFQLSSAEELVPLVAFNLSAAASGILAGRLNDKARAAEQARSRMRALLAVSQKLQRAVRISEIPAAAGDFSQVESGAVEIFIIEGKTLQPVRPEPLHTHLAEKLLRSGRPSFAEFEWCAFLLPGGDGPLGVVVLPCVTDTSAAGQHDVETFLTLLSIAIERCILLAKLSEAELVRRSEEFKTALLSSVSHDMRTPLSAISASASSLARYGPSLGEETQADLLQMIQEQCERLNRYTSNLLNLSRLQAGVDRTSFIECDAVEAMGGAIAQSRTLQSGHKIIKRLEISTAIVAADPAMLEQSFYNVLENAVRYGSVSEPIIVSARPDGDGILVIIEDRGPGIPPEEIDRVFDRFYRTPANSSHRGTGLGLSITRGFVEAFGGTVNIESSWGKAGGTSVRIWLPALDLTRAGQ